MNQETLHAGLHLNFNRHLRARQYGALVLEWLLDQARYFGIGGDSATGFDRHGTMREQYSFELADDLPLKIESLLPKFRPSSCWQKYESQVLTRSTRARTHTLCRLAKLD